MQYLYKGKIGQEMSKIRDVIEYEYIITNKDISLGRTLFILFSKKILLFI